VAEAAVTTASGTFQRGAFYLHSTVLIIHLLIAELGYPSVWPRSLICRLANVVSFQSSLFNLLEQLQPHDWQELPFAQDTMMTCVLTTVLSAPVWGRWPTSTTQLPGPGKVTWQEACGPLPILRQHAVPASTQWCQRPASGQPRRLPCILSALIVSWNESFPTKSDLGTSLALFH
jgi:hypothetical protein